MSEWIAATVAVFVGTMIGNYMGDNATIKECVTKGHATMVNGVRIKCETVTEKP